MSKQLEAEIDDLMRSLRLKPRSQWADETGSIIIASRCAGSYGCSTPVVKSYSGEEMVSRAQASAGGEFVSELARLLAAGVHLENAAAALGRKYGSNEALAPHLSRLIQLLGNPDARRADFASVISDIAGEGGDSSSRDAVMTAINEGRLDDLAD